MEPYAAYRPIRRINQACISCRRKKARCSGQRPQCSNCERLSIECEYQDHPSQSGSQSCVTKSDLDNVLHIASGLGERLKELQSQVQFIAASQKQILAALSSSQNAQNAQNVSNGVDTSDHGSVGGSVGGNIGPIFPTSENGFTRQMVPSPSSTQLTDDRIFSSTSLPPSVIQSTVDTYFAFCHNQPYSFFHEETFHQRLAEGEIPHHLLCAIIATSIRFSNDPFWGDDKEEAAATLASLAWRSIISTEFSAHEVADVYTVQSITLLAIFDYTAGRSRHGSAWVKIGVAIRIAQDLRLQLPPPTDLPCALQEERRRVFWSIFLLDRLACCGRDRPCAILESSCQLQLPQSESAWRSCSSAGSPAASTKRQRFAAENITLEHFMSRRSPTTLTLNVPASSSSSDDGGVLTADQPPQAQMVIMAHLLGRAAQYMLQQLDAFNAVPPWDPRSDLAVIESDLIHLETLLHLRRPLPAVVAECTRTAADGTQAIDQQALGPVIFTRALFHLCYCILHHPFLLRKRASRCQMAYPFSLLARSLDTAYGHAKQLTLWVRDAREAGCLVHTSFYGYCVMVAGYIVSFYTGAGEEGVRSEACGLLYANVGYLEELGGMWKNAALMAAGLKQLAEVAYKFHPLVSGEECVSLSQEEEDLLWSLVDYNTMSNGAPEPTALNDTGVGSLYWSDINEQWCDLFAPLNRRAGSIDLLFQ